MVFSNLLTPYRSDHFLIRFKKKICPLHDYTSIPRSNQDRFAVFINFSVDKPPEPEYTVVS